MLKRLKICVLAAAMWLCIGNAQAKELVVDRAIFEDTTAAMTLDLIKSTAFKPAGEVVFVGFTRSALWVRLNVDVPAGAGPLAVRIRPTLLDSATLYYPAASAGGPDIALDMSARLAQKDTRIELQPGMNTVFLRAESIGAMLIKAQVLLVQDALDQDLKEHLELGAVLAFYALLLCAMVVLVAVIGRQLVFFFVLHLVICLALYFLVFDFLGEANLWHWAKGKTASRLIAISNFWSFALLMQAVLGYFGMPRAQRFARFSFVCLVLLALLFLVGDQHLALKLTAFVGALTTVGLLTTLVYLIFKFSRDQKIPWGVRLVNGLIVGLFVVIVTNAMLQILGVLAGGNFLLQSPAWRGILIPLAMIGFLMHRDRLLTEAAIRSELAREIAELKILEKAQRLTTQSQFMAMLMHELKTPLYIIQIAAASLSRHMAYSHPDTQRLDNIARAADDMNFIIDRCVQADQLDQNDEPVNKTSVALKTLLSEVMHVKGHERITFSGVDQAGVVTDFQYARIILINLVTNALKYSPPESSVVLDVQETHMVDGPGLTIRVSNTVGSSGRPDPLRVFTRYYRAEGAKKEVGAGLGLWLAHTIATKLGCELRCSGDDALVHFDFSLRLN